MSALLIGHGSLQGIPDHTAYGMMMRHGSTELLRAIRGEPEPEPEPVKTNLPKLRTRRHIRTADRQERPRTPAAQRILEQVAEAFEIEVADIVGRERQQRIWIARTVAIRLMRDLDRFGNYSTTQIGAMMGNRDHSTICNALSKFPVWCALYPEVAELYDRLRAA